MDITKQLTANQIQGYLSKGAALLPHIYEHFLVQLYAMEQEKQICMLPVSIFNLYHIRLERKLTSRIAQHQIRISKRKVA
jgi:hypothetical protein